MSAVLQLKQVSLALSISSQYLLQDISFQLEKSERWGIVGASGSGKTTLLRLLNRLDNPTAGAIYFDNKPLTQIPVIQLRQQVVLVPQEPKLLGMTVENTLIYPLKLQQLPPADIKSRIELVRSQLKIPTDWLERNELQLSLGQRQLVAIARALVMQPRILLLDEPTSALDAGNSDHLLETLIQISQSTETAIIMANHQLNLVEQFAQKIIYLEQGQIKDKKKASEVHWQQLQDQLKQTKAKQNWKDEEL